MDRIWIGYIIGASACGVTAVISEFIEIPVWFTLLMFAAYSPVVIWTAICLDEGKQ